MKLKLIEWLESSIMHIEADRTKLGRALLTRKFPDSEEMMQLKYEHREVVDYRLHIGARFKHIPRDPHAKERVFKLLVRELFKDLIEEIYLTEEWAYQEGYDPAMIGKLERLRKLASGEEVDD